MGARLWLCRVCGISDNVNAAKPTHSTTILRHTQQLRIKEQRNESLEKLLQTFLLFLSSKNSTAAAPQKPQQQQNSPTLLLRTESKLRYLTRLCCRSFACRMYPNFVLQHPTTSPSSPPPHHPAH